MKTIYLVRHGEAESNLNPDIVQADDSPLTEKGKEQAALIAERATRLEFSAMVASTMRRTQETAAFISSATRKEFESEPLFVERRIPTSIVGKSMSDPAIKARLDEWEISTTTSGTRVDDGENFDDLSERAGRVITYLENRPENNILVVGHGFFTRMIVARMWFGAGLTAEQFKPLQWGMRTRNTGITVLRHDLEDEHGPWWLHVWNDHSHLG